MLIPLVVLLSSHDALSFPVLPRGFVARQERLLTSLHARGRGRSSRDGAGEKKGGRKGPKRGNKARRRDPGAARTGGDSGGTATKAGNRRSGSGGGRRGRGEKRSALYRDLAAYAGHLQRFVDLERAEECHRVAEVLAGQSLEALPKI